MSTIAYLDLELHARDDKMLSAKDILSLLVKHNWSFFMDGEAMFLPIGDDDMYDWQGTSTMSESALFDLAVQKSQLNERVGVSLYWKDSGVGGEVIIGRPNSLSFSLSANRRTIFDRIPDVNWYLERLLPCFCEDGVCILRLEFGLF